MTFHKPFLADPSESSKSTSQSESPFLSEELFADMEAGGAEVWASRPAEYRLESPFQLVFEPDQVMWSESNVDEFESAFYDEEKDFDEDELGQEAGDEAILTEVMTAEEEPEGDHYLTMIMKQDTLPGQPDLERKKMELYLPFTDEEIFASEAKEWKSSSRYLLESPFLDVLELTDLEAEAADERFGELEDQEFNEEPDYEALAIEREDPKPPAPRLLRSKTTLPGQTLYVEINLQIGKAPNKAKDLFQVEPMTGIFIPKNYSPESQVDLILYLHGHKAIYPGDNVSIDGYWDNPQFPFFALREGINASGKNVILVAPTLGPLSQSGNLINQKGFDNYLDQAMEALKAHGPYQGKSPTVGNIILAGHSGGGSPMQILALSKNRYAANIKEVWGFDSLYGGETTWAKWAEKNQTTGRVYMYYHPATKYWSKKKKRDVKLSEHANNLAKKNLANVVVKEADPKTVKGHFWMPIAYWTERIQNAPLSSRPTSQNPTPELELDTPFFYEANRIDMDLEASTAEEPEGFLDELDEAGFDEEMDEEMLAELLADEDEEREAEEPEGFLDELDEEEWHGEVAIEALAEFFAGEEQKQRAEELLDELDESQSDDIGETEFEEEVEQEALDGIDLLAESPPADRIPFPSPIKSVKSPLAVPPSNPASFAEPPPRGSYWPVRTKRKEGRSVAFKAMDGTIVGARGEGRMFLANRKGKRDGKETPRWHVGIDLFANIGDPVIACEDGKIVNFSYFYPAKSGQKTYRLLVEHSTAVINYGEITSNSLVDNNLTEGSQVKASQVIGFVSDTSMLHFETYAKGTTTTHRWWKDERTPPRALLNPTRYLLFLQEHGLPGSDAGTQPATPVTSTFRSLAERIQDALNLGRWSVALGFAILGGERDVNNLTNLVFYARHRDLAGHKIQPHEKDLAREWLAIRDNLVKPALKLASFSPSAPTTSSSRISTASGDAQGPLATLTIKVEQYSLPEQMRFSYTFTSEDTLWLARFIVGEAGGRDDADNKAIIWAMFNRYAFFAHKVKAWDKFHKFIRAYSTTLQPSLNSWQAAERVLQANKKNPEKYPIKLTGGFYEPPHNDIPRVQYVKFLQLQKRPWQELPAKVRALAEQALKGQIPNPGIGVASEFANTLTYYRQSCRRKKKKDPNYKCDDNPTYEQWRQYTEAYARNDCHREHKRCIWIGEKPNLDQKGKNAFFIDNRVKDVPPEAVAVELNK